MAAKKIRKSLLISAAPMVGSFLAGLILVVGHHLFYAHLAGTNAPAGSYRIAGSDVPKQRFNTAVGTTFAFLVKAALAIAVWIAYVQLFWRSVRTSIKGERLSTLDAMFSVPQDFTSFVRARVWFRYPALFLLAVIAWSIPIAAIITPATLSVESATTRTDTLHSVPKFDFTTFNFIAPPTLSGIASNNGSFTTADFTNYYYRGPSRIVDRISSSVAAQGELLAIKPPALNASWNLDFYGPELRCNNVSEEQRHNISVNVWEYYMNANDCASSWSYMAWVPLGDQYVPFLNASRATNSTQSAMNLPPSMLGDHLPFGRPATLMVAVIPGLFLSSVNLPSHIVPAGCAYGNENYKIFASSVLSGSTFLECQVFNTSLLATFEYVNGDQKIAVTRRPRPDDARLVPLEYMTGPINPTNGGTGFILGPEEEKNRSCSTLNLSGKQCEFQPEILRILSYQAIVDAFNRLVQGTIGLNADALDPGLDPQTNLLDTVLQNSNELKFLDWSEVLPNSTIPSLPALVEDSDGIEYQGLYVDATTSKYIPLATALEQLFQNITISLLSEKVLQPDPSSKFAPSLEANVTLSRRDNIYVYAKETLWLAYGIAITCTFIAVGAGAIALALNGASFSNDFSTIVRVSRMATLSEEVTESDGDGTEPLPKHLADSRLLMKQKRETSSLSGSASVGEGDRNAQKTSLLSTHEANSARS